MPSSGTSLGAVGIDGFVKEIGSVIADQVYIVKNWLQDVRYLHLKRRRAGLKGSVERIQEGEDTIISFVEQRKQTTSYKTGLFIKGMLMES